MAERANKPWATGRAGILPAVVLSLFVSVPTLWAASQKPSKTDRPEVPFGFTGLSPVQAGAYDMKAQPAAVALEALTAMTLKGWETIRKYYPKLGVISETGGVSVNPRDPEDRRFYAAFATEDPGRSPVPLISAICSLESSEVSGDLKALREELLEAMRVEDYSTWTSERLRQVMRGMTQEQITAKGVKYRAAKRTLTFKETVQLYAMTLALLQKDTTWTKWSEAIKKMGYPLPPLPDMVDFTNRLSHQLPVIIAPGATRGLLLYRPGWDIAQPVTKEEYEERADVVLIRRAGTTFHIEEFPIYLTNNQKEWNPAWIEERDEAKDTTLIARKFEGDWTRFDGPYMWPKGDQLTGEDAYRATVKFRKGEIVIEAERFVLRRGAVVRTWRDRTYDPLNMKRFDAGIEVPEAPLTAELPSLDIWPAMWRLMSWNINETCYRHDDRELFWYKVDENSWSSSIYPRKDAGEAALRPAQPVTALTSGIVARFAGVGAMQPSDVQLLNDEQKTSVNLASGLMNRCLANAGGTEVNELRGGLPRDQENQTPIYFYSVRNGTSVRKSPDSLVVVLSEGYYNSYISAFNRLLWVLEKPFANDAVKVESVHRAMEAYLQNGIPKDADQSSDPVLIAWSQALQSGGVDQLLSASIVPRTVKGGTPSGGIDAAKTGFTAARTGDWLRSGEPGEDSGASRLDSTEAKSSETALGLMNLYLAKSDVAWAEQWRGWYPQGTSVGFRMAGSNGQGRAKEEIREITSAQGEKRTEVEVMVELPERAYSDYPTALVWVLGVLEVNARNSDRSRAGSIGGQGTGVASVLEFLRELNPLQDLAVSQTLMRLGVDAKTLAASLPDVPTMFLSASRVEGATEAGASESGKAAAAHGHEDSAPVVARRIIAAQFPSDVGLGPLSESEQAMTGEVVRVMNLYLNKREEKKDKAAEQLRQNLTLVTNLFLYRNTSETINVKQGSTKVLFVGLPAQNLTYAALFVELLRVVEMQDERLTNSWERRQEIAGSIRNFLGAYAKENPSDTAATQLSQVEIKTMTELW